MQLNRRHNNERLCHTTALVSAAADRAAFKTGDKTHACRQPPPQSVTLLSDSFELGWTELEHSIATE